jgi:predicted nucleic acid-binding protein
VRDAAVVDASVAVKRVVDEPDSGLARSLAGARLEAPDLLPIECANILWKKVGIGDLTRPEAARRLEVLLHAPVALTVGGELLDLALDVALEWQHPVYDCLYVALAIRRNIPLVTADKRLAGAARKRKRHAARVILLAELPTP